MTCIMTEIDPWLLNTEEAFFFIVVILNWIAQNLMV